jgi:tRNA modification GTPase
LRAIETHLTSSIKGSLIQTGIKTVLLGAPNAGKSSLLNILAQRPAAIVSPEPGTTRDVVEVLLDIAGFACIVGDTAGLREGGDVGIVEQEGVSRAKKRAEISDLIFLVVDATLPVEKALEGVKDFVISENDTVTSVLVLNKIDLINGFDNTLVDSYSSATGLSKDHIFPISCLTKQGLETFGAGMAKLLRNMTGSAENVLATNERQRRLLSECITCLTTFLGTLRPFTL